MHQYMYDLFPRIAKTRLGRDRLSDIAYKLCSYFTSEKNVYIETIKNGLVKVHVVFLCVCFGQFHWWTRITMTPGVEHEG